MSGDSNTVHSFLDDWPVWLAMDGSRKIPSAHPLCPRHLGSSMGPDSNGSQHNGLGPARRLGKEHLRGMRYSPADWLHVRCLWKTGNMSLVSPQHRSARWAGWRTRIINECVKSNINSDTCMYLSGCRARSSTRCYLCNCPVSACACPGCCCVVRVLYARCVRVWVQRACAVC